MFRHITINNGESWFLVRSGSTSVELLQSVVAALDLTKYVSQQSRETKKEIFVGGATSSMMLLPVAGDAKLEDEGYAIRCLQF